MSTITPSICFAQKGKTCSTCKGEGSYDCWVCRGTGETTNYTLGGINYVECKGCNGSGVIKCPVCRGKGTITRPAKGKNTYYHIKKVIIPASTGNPPELIEDDPSDPNNTYINAVIHPGENVYVTNIYGQTDIYRYKGKNNDGKPYYTKRFGDTTHSLEVSRNSIEIKSSFHGIINYDIYKKY